MSKNEFDIWNAGLSASRWNTVEVFCPTGLLASSYLPSLPSIVASLFVYSIQEHYVFCLSLRRLVFALPPTRSMFLSLIL